jgi:hypothetical protein
MSRLAQQQSALLGALFAWPAQNAIEILAAHADLTSARGLNVYQANGHMLAERALLAAYPVVAQLIGMESFGQLARALWHAAPPTRGDIAEWGEAMASFLGDSPQLQDEPYLPDVARVEWALHRCAGASNVDTDLASVALLTSHDPDALRFVLSPGCAVVRSAWPVASIVGAHLHSDPTWDTLTERMRAQVAEDTVVWREGLRPGMRTALAGEANVLLALLAGKTLGQALDASPELDFGNWLPTAVRTGLVLGVLADPAISTP